MCIYTQNVIKTSLRGFLYAQSLKSLYKFFMYVKTYSFTLKLFAVLFCLFLKSLYAPTVKMVSSSVCICCSDCPLSISGPSCSILKTQSRIFLYLHLEFQSKCLIWLMWTESSPCFRWPMAIFRVWRIVGRLITLHGHSAWCWQVFLLSRHSGKDEEKRLKTI